MPDPKAVQSMFARIAGSYDLLNRTLSLGIDQRWRKRLLRQSGVRPGMTVVDVCCGTGDVALLYARSGAQVLGLDFTHPMLERAEKKRGDNAHTLFADGDAMNLPVASGIADVCSVSFGIRNVAERRGCMREMKRVLRPGGQVLILEFSMPPGRIFGWIYRTYFTRVLPAIGKLVSKDDDAYSYLPRTVLAWPKPAELQGELEQEGFVDCGHELLTMGIACLHWGRVPQA
ncbi:MAG: bifunctional demethylmenaquinone methyltransferase/2-methoxy-6-polyprenyl-1,4-benzoquinol methylase UbiE [Planctomycetia bacterium]